MAHWIASRGDQSASVLDACSYDALLPWSLMVVTDFCDETSHVRRGPGFYNCSLTIEHCEDGGKDIAGVQLSEDDQGLAAGQFPAFYHERRCLCSGVILESWDDQGFPVCEKALEIARMEDKSKLGKPAKIKLKPETPTEFDCNKGVESSRNLFNGQNGVAEKSNTTSQVQEEAIPRFPGNWVHKLRGKWTHIS